MKNIFIQFLKSNKQILLFIILFLTFRGAIADWNLVPTGSMQPTIKEGDVILVNRLAYDIKLPFSDITLASINTPSRGDIIVFKSKAANNRLVKRVIGLPGDSVSLHGNRLSINGDAADYNLINETSETLTLEETIAGFQHAIKINKYNNSSSRNFDTVMIPTGYYLVLGDNRDNSADSRFYGLVPHSEIVGRSKLVLWSYNFDNYYLPRKNRLFDAL